MKSGKMKPKRSAQCTRGRDRLSELPDEVIVHILSFLPTLDAVRTLLLRRFGYLWTLIPTLRFGDSDFFSESDEDMVSSTALDSRFLLFVRNVLFLHKRPTIDKFHIYIKKCICWEDADMAVAELEMWIRFALGRDTKELSLGFGSSDYYFPLPVSIYTSQSLVTLSLDDCRIKVPSQVYMGSLRTLEIVNSRVDDNFNELVIGCPCLKEVSINQAEDMLLLRSPSIEKLEFKADLPIVPCTIDCPNLKILDIHVILDYVKVINVPSVREVTVFCCFEFSEDNAHKYKKFLEGFQSAEVLTFIWEVEEELAYCLTVDVGFPKNRWKRVVLQSSMEDSCILAICNLVRNSPCLEELIIYATFSKGFEGEIIRKLASQEVSSPCVVPYLKVVSMHGYGNPSFTNQLKLAEFLLKSAVNLDKLIVISYPGGRLTKADELVFVKQLSKFPRASTKAMILFE